MTGNRNSNLDVRVAGGRVYDSRNGTSCHQCRHSTMDFIAPYKGMKNNNKICPKKFCYKCLLNRYGENAEEVATLNDWVCHMSGKQSGYLTFSYVVTLERAGRAYNHALPSPSLQGFELYGFASPLRDMNTEVLRINNRKRWGWIERDCV